MDGWIKSTILWIKCQFATTTNARQFTIRHSKLIFGHCQWIFHCRLLSNSDLKSSFRPLFFLHSLHPPHVLAQSICYITTWFLSIWLAHEFVVLILSFVSFVFIIIIIVSELFCVTGFCRIGNYTDNSLLDIIWYYTYIVHLYIHHTFIVHER